MPVLVVFYFLILYPYLLSPLRHIPGPSLGNPITGQFPAIINGEAGVPQREWVKKYGSVVRVVGPLGIERVIFTRPEALAKVLVADWVDYPRVSLIIHLNYSDMSKLPSSLILCDIPLV